MREISTVTVIGAGLMGHGIAQVASQFAGYSVYMVDVSQDLLNRGMKMIESSLEKFVQKGRISREEAGHVISRIKATTEIQEALSRSDFVIEAATEDKKIKLELFKSMSKYASRDAILTSNTSSISITLLSSVVDKRERVCGMHFFNPPQLMPLVEVVRGLNTSDDTVEAVRKVAQKMQKETVVCKKDTPGFIVNRILVPALNEAVQLVEEGVAEPEDIDKAVKLGLNWPMGPLQLLDYVGLDTTLNIVNVFLDEFNDSKYRPSNLLKRMVNSGMLGRKTGRGFYTWSEPGATKPS